MTKDVTVKMEGLLLDSEDEPIIIVASGTYHLHNGRHYIRFDEIPEGGGESIKNTVKIGITQVDMTKKGGGSSHINFDLDKITEAYYQTPYGDLSLEVKTSKISVKEAPDIIQVILEYAIFTNEDRISDNRAIITISSMNQG